MSNDVATVVPEPKKAVKAVASPKITKRKPGEPYTMEDFIQSEGYQASNAVVRGERVYADRPRLPSGIFSVDYVMGGGLPLFGTTMVFGPEQGGKTSFVMQILSQLESFCMRCFRHAARCTCANRSPLIMKGFVVAAESDFDGAWATTIGAKPSSYYIGYPEYFEDASRMTTLAMEAEDCGLVAVDSIAAIDSIMSKQDLEDNEVAVMGKQVTRFCKKMHSTLIKLMRKKDKPLFLVLVTQARADMDQKGHKSFGANFKPYGPYAVKHMNSYLLLSTKSSFSDSEKDKFKASNDDLFPRASKHMITIQKYKFTTLRRRATYIREMVDEGPLNRGQLHGNMRTAARYAKELGIIDTAGQKLYDKWLRDPGAFAEFQRQVIDHAKKSLLP